MASVNDVTSNSSVTANTAIKGKGVSELTMDDFFQLLVAEMTNQDLFGSSEGSSSSSSGMAAQMAQFSTLQGLQTIQEYQQMSYATSYVGKEVTIAKENETTGKMETIKGTVESVTFYDGSPKVIVDGKSYDLHTVMEISTPNSSGSALNQASSYIGKTVTLTDVDSDGKPFDVKGVVESVTLKGGKPYVTVNGKDYPASSITDVASTAAKEEENTGDNGLDGDDA